MKTSAMHAYWLVWFLASFTTFFIPEMVALATGNPQNTLSDAVWYFERLVPGQPIIDWTFWHFVFTFGFLVVAIWLSGHFGWGLWASGLVGSGRKA